MKTIVLTPGPRCERCGHVVCPFCLEWCDTLNDGELCCDGSCVFEVGAIERWQKENSEAFNTMRKRACLVSVAVGPWQEQS